VAGEIQQSGAVCYSLYLIPMSRGNFPPYPSPRQATPDSGVVTTKIALAGSEAPSMEKYGFHISRRVAAHHVGRWDDGGSRAQPRTLRVSARGRRTFRVPGIQQTMQSSCRVSLRTSGSGATESMSSRYCIRRGSAKWFMGPDEISLVLSELDTPDSKSALSTDVRPGDRFGFGQGRRQR